MQLFDFLMVMVSNVLGILNGRIPQNGTLKFIGNLGTSLQPHKEIK